MRRNVGRCLVGDITVLRRRAGAHRHSNTAAVGIDGDPAAVGCADVAAGVLVDGARSGDLDLAGLGADDGIKFNIPGRTGRCQRDVTATGGDGAVGAQCQQVVGDYQRNIAGIGVVLLLQFGHDEVTTGSELGDVDVAGTSVHSAQRAVVRRDAGTELNVKIVRSGADAGAGGQCCHRRNDIGTCRVIAAAAVGDGTGSGDAGIVGAGIDIAEVDIAVGRLEADIVVIITDVRGIDQSRGDRTTGLDGDGTVERRQ